MRIRKATIKDFEKLKEIKSEFSLWECKGDKRLDPNYIKKGLGSRLAKNLKQDNVVFFIAEEKGDIVGYAGGDIQKNPSFVRSKKRGHLFNLYVKPGYRKKGIGRKLAKQTFKWFKEKGIDDLMIMVHSYNKRAYKIYKKLGFRDYIIELKR